MSISKNVLGLGLILMTLFVFSCTDQEVIGDTEAITFEKQLKLDQLEYEKYVSEHGEVTVELMTLEELQVFIAENNLPPVSQKTIDAYHKFDFSKASGPCSSGWINYCGDLNGDSTFSSGDLSYFSLTCSVTCSSPNACSTSSTCDSWTLPSNMRRFGYLSWYDDPAEQQLIYNAKDYNRAVDMILGLGEPC